MWGNSFKSRDHVVTCHTTAFKEWLDHIDALISYKTWKLTGESKYAKDFDFNWQSYYKKGSKVADAVNEALQCAGYLPSEEGLKDFEED